MNGVEEEVTEFDHSKTDPAVLALAGTPFAGLNRYRTFGESGPMYEVLAIKGDKVRIWLFNSHDETDYRLADATTDPIAH